MSKNYALAFSKPDANPIAIGIATASIFNEISEKKKPKLIKDNFVLVLSF